MAVNSLRQGFFERPATLEARVDDVAVNASGLCLRTYGILKAVFVHGFVRWCANSAFNTPAKFVNAIPNESLGNSSQIAPFANQTSLAVSLQNCVGSFVAALSFYGRPAAVLFGVWARVVYAINGVFSGRTRSHVIKEPSEGLSPLVANDNAAPAIVNETLAIRIMATMNHCNPRFVFARVAHPVMFKHSHSLSKDSGKEMTK